MDDYKKYYYAARPSAKDKPYGEYVCGEFVCSSLRAWCVHLQVCVECDVAVGVVMGARRCLLLFLLLELYVSTHVAEL